MSIPTSLFDYHLPAQLIAQQSVRPRDHSRLLVLDRTTGALRHRHFFELCEELHAGDVLVLNDTKVFCARLQARVHGQEIELFLLRPIEYAGKSLWQALVRPGRRVHVQDVIQTGEMCAVVEAKEECLLIRFDRSSEDVIAFANQHGAIPIPPYVHQMPQDLQAYQTLYARHTGSVAAPTAGFHFTQNLIQNLSHTGVEFLYVTLHVGLGTFRPVRISTLEEHQMHHEFASIDVQTAEAIHRAKQAGRRIIAVGTTTVRTLEGVAALHAGRVVAFSGDVNLFITPGFDFKVVDALITNFHVPKSTLLVLVSAFAGRELILNVYQEAIKEQYRFYSFGDAMMIR